MRFFLALLFVLGVVPATAAEKISGPACVVDGDTLAIGGDGSRGYCQGGQRVRLNGIDAPEQKQQCQRAKGGSYRCGDAATDALRDMIGRAPVTCTATATPDRYGRMIANCQAGGVVLNAAMVRLGWAVAYRRYSTEFVKPEDEARKAKRGIWAGAFAMPEDWRAANPRK